MDVDSASQLRVLLYSLVSKEMHGVFFLIFDYFIHLFLFGREYIESE